MQDKLARARTPAEGQDPVWQQTGEPAGGRD